MKGEFFSAQNLAILSLRLHANESFAQLEVGYKKNQVKEAHSMRGNCKTV